MPDLPAHSSPVISPTHLHHPRPSSSYLTAWDDLQDGQPSTPGLPSNLLSPAFTPPATPGLTSGTTTPSLRHEPKSIPVDTAAEPLTSGKQPRLLERLPVVECVVRARIPTVSGAEMFLHLYQNDVDNKEHLAIVFGNHIRSRSLDREREGESEMDRMIRGAYVGRLRPGRVSSRIDSDPGTSIGKRKRAGSKLKEVHSAAVDSNGAPDAGTQAVEKQTDDDAPSILPSAPTSTDNRPLSPEEQKLASARADLEDTLLSTSISSTSSDPDDADSPSKPPLVRIHSECYTGETAWSARCDCGEQLDEAARLMSLPSPSTISPSTGGVIVYLRQEGRGIGLASKLKAYNLQDLGSDTVEANLLLRHPADARSYGLATSILVDLGCGGERGIRLLTNNPEKVRAVEGPGREVRVRERVAMVPLSWKTGGKSGVRGREIERYLETKIGRMGHVIGEDDGEG